MSHPSAAQSSSMPPATRQLPLTIIVAATSNRGIGLKGQLPWHIKADLQYFARVTSRTSSPSSSSTTSTSQAQSPALSATTTQPQTSPRRNAVIMGRKTWESIPPKFRPLKNRVNVVISRNAPTEARASSTSTSSTTPAAASGSISGWNMGPIWVDSLERAVQVLQETADVAKDAAVAAASADVRRRGEQSGTTTTIPEIERAYVIGGAQIYKAAGQLDLAVGRVDSVLLTHVFGEHEVDTYLPEDYESSTLWKRASAQELQEFAGENVPEGRQRENNAEFEFRLYKRTNGSIHASHE